MFLPGSTTLTSVLGHQSDEIETSGLIGNFVPTAGIASTHWTNQAASNALRRFNGITHNNSAPHNFQFDGSDDYLGEASSGYGGSSFGVNTYNNFTMAQWYKHRAGYRHVPFSLTYSGSDLITVWTGQRVLNKMSVSNDQAAHIDFSDYTFSDNTWYYIALVRDGSTYSFFVNGSFVGSGTLATQGVDPALFQVGATGVTGTTYTQSGLKVGHIHVHSTALKNSQIRQNMLASHDINDARIYGSTYTA